MMPELFFKIPDNLSEFTKFFVQSVGGVFPPVAKMLHREWGSEIKVVEKIHGHRASPVFWV